MPFLYLIGCIFQLDFGKLLFEDIACMIYDMIDARRQWRGFLSNIKLYHVPQFGEGSALSQAQGSMMPIFSSIVCRALCQ